jgi:thioredoxin reductase/bacterioferritin-associated ferredoxin
VTPDFDLIVIGAGPAGCRSALAASRHGLSVLLVDEAAEPGGQVYRAPANGLLPKLDEDSENGHELRRRVGGSAVTLRCGCRVWSVSDGFRVDVAGPSGHEAFSAPRLCAATGAYERVVPFPGWTLPGVIGLAAATILIKSQGMLPGRRLVLAGCGPLLLLVAAKVLAVGGEIAAIADLASPADWLSTLPRALRRPHLALRGAGWAAAIGRSRVPIHFRHGVRAAIGRDRVESVEIGPLDRSGAPAAGNTISLEVDALAVGHGLVPGAEIPRLLEAKMIFDRLHGGWIPQVDEFGRTSRPGLYAVGDGAGIRGAEPALLAGELAGLAAARDAGRISAATYDDETKRPLRQRRCCAPFADAMAGMMALRPEQAAAIPPEAVVCRCEDVTREGIENAAAAGALDVNQMKNFTRCGMGPCQGRMCGNVAAELFAQSRKVQRDTVGYWTGRPPLRPVPLSDLVGSFEYDDIPIPRPGPL